VKYRHYLTFRYERTSSGIEGWISVNVDSSGPLISNDSLMEAIESVRLEMSARLRCHPGEIMVFIVNHTTVTL
jgi:hypothetical protein